MKFFITLLLTSFWYCANSNAINQSSCVELFTYRITEQDVLRNLPTRLNEWWVEPSITGDIEWSFFTVVGNHQKFIKSSSQGNQVGSLFEIGFIKSRKTNQDKKLVQVVRLSSTKEVIARADRGLYNEVNLIPKYVFDGIGASSHGHSSDWRGTLSAFFHQYFFNENEGSYSFEPQAQLDF